jgi:hypothetical protein
MSTQEQTNANRKNAEKSTGPKTPEGKATASQNAVKHGFFAKNDVISGEDLALYEAHRQNIYDEFVPLTPTESVLTQRIASLTWRLMRADRLQTTPINTLVAAQHKATHKPGIPEFNIEAMIKALRRKEADPDYALTDAGIILSGLARYRYETVTTDPAVDEAIHAASNPTPGTSICEAEIELGTVIYNDFNGSAVIERLQGYEQKIESSLFKTIRLIQQIQDRRIIQTADREKRDWQRFREEDEARKREKEAEYQERINASYPPDEEQERRNEANSELTSTTETTYNKSHCAEDKRNEHNQTDLPNPDDHPGRSDNK